MTDSPQRIQRRRKRINGVTHDSNTIRLFRQALILEVGEAESEDFVSYARWLKSKNLTTMRGSK